MQCSIAIFRLPPLLFNIRHTHGTGMVDKTAGTGVVDKTAIVLHV